MSREVLRLEVRFARRDDGRFEMSVHEGLCDGADVFSAEDARCVMDVVGAALSGRRLRLRAALERAAAPGVASEGANDA